MGITCIYVESNYIYGQLKQTLNYKNLKSCRLAESNSRIPILSKGSYTKIISKLNANTLSNINKTRLCQHIVKNMDECI